MYLPHSGKLQLTLKRTITGLTVLLLTLLMLSGHVFAQSGPRAHVAIAYHKAGNHYNIVVKGVPGDRLDLYVNDKHPPTTATVDKQGWATFNGVKLTGSGKVSFTRVITRQNKSTYQRRINFHEQYAVSNGRATFTYPQSPKPTTTATPAPTPAPSTPAPSPTPDTTPTPTPSPTPSQSCTPLTNGGNCYEPGEYCRDSDHGTTGVAGDGKPITCSDNDGWRWEPS